MKQLIISVPNMQSTHCQNRVNNAVKNIEGVHIHNMEPGSLTVSFNSKNQEDEVINAIEKAGYTVSTEENNTASDTDSGCCIS